MENEQEEKPNPVELERAAKRWEEWLCTDLKHFLQPLASASGLTVQEVLLYLMNERLSQMTDGGVRLHIIVHRPEGDDDDEEPWKRGGK